MPVISLDDFSSGELERATHDRALPSNTALAHPITTCMGLFSLFYHCLDSDVLTKERAVRRSEELDKLASIIENLV